MSTYLSSYGAATKRRTRGELNRLKWFYMGEPEFLNCVIAMADDAQSQGVDLGIGGIWRSAATQDALHLKQPNLSPSSGGSYHEECCPTPNGLRALAVDFLTTGGQPVKDYIIKNANRFNLVSLHDYKGEYWHCQPLKIPRSRRNQFNPSVHTPNLWALTNVPPGPPSPLPLKHTVKVLPNGMDTNPKWDGSNANNVRWLQQFFKEQAWWNGNVDGYWTAAFQDTVKMVQNAFHRTVYNSSPKWLTRFDGVWWQETAVKIDAWMKVQDWYKP